MDDLDTFIEAGAAMLGLPVDPAWRPGVRAHLATLLQHAALVVAADLPDETEQAPVYCA